MIPLLMALALLQAGDPAAATVKGADLELLEEVRAIGGQVSDLRGETFARPPVAVRVPDDMRRVAADIRAFNVLSRERLEARGRAWEEIGLGGRESPRELLRALAGDLDGIGFDPEANRLLVSPELLDPRDFLPREDEAEPATVLMLTGVRPDGPLVGHYLMHLRQRERAGRDLLRETTDELLASMAWTEGEANLVAVRYLFGGMGLADDVISLELNLEEVLEGRLLPSRLGELSGVAGGFARFVYLEGYHHAARAYLEGGWGALDAAMAARKTTRALLHPGAPAGPPVTFTEPQVPAIEGLRLADEDSLGEQAIVVLVSTLTGKDNLGLMAGEGWNGDRLYRWETESGADGFTDWVSHWKNPSEAKEFEYAFRRTLEARFPGGQPVSEGEGRLSLAAGGRVFRVRRQGGVVTVRIVPEAWDERLREPI